MSENGSVWSAGRILDGENCLSSLEARRKAFGPGVQLIRSATEYE